ncbi:ABC transporter substrate-binding protein [Homoserinibacter sp. GY 40078]|uniref:ABC transporter substrate-binding protein n=1 Tax=Homoserinibacter sp. GY 40078 TaxID=2603275 RepID=UPI0011CC1BC4|nr:ABC transporter substrate-binding protein [Homoserinibacter sp. GY 40078]TXK17146.1 ABC transporter substrate-binding protein [Homoserinibacter sp. GY 40078]
MSTARTGRLAAIGAIAASAALVLAGCSTGDPLDSGDGSNDAGTIVVGSQAYYSNEIIAEIYAQALEGAGFDVERNFNIGQRDAYLPALESGEVDLFPEYTGNLLQFYDPETEATTSDDVYAALKDALPDGLTVLDQSPATDQDSYNVTSAFADEYEVNSLADLAALDIPLTIGGPPELEERPYGPSGLESKYGLTVSFEATGDTTVEDLVAGTIDMGNVYSADPRIQTEGLVTLADPEGLFLASNVVPLVNADIADEVADVINAVSAALTPQGLVALNVQSTVDEMSSADIASKWLSDQGLA